MIPGLAIAWLAILGASTGNVPATVEEETRFLRAIEGMADAVEEIRDYTCTFTKQELVRGTMHPENTIFMKHRGPSVCLYMKWIEEPHLGREAIYCEGRYENELQVHEGSGVASWLDLSLDPRGSVAMRESRRPITEAGLYNAVDLLVGGFREAAERGDRRGFRRVYEDAIHGQPSLCIDSVAPGADGGSEERIGRSQVCIHRELRLPTALRFWDQRANLLGAYTYRDYRLNVGLTDRDFDVDNEEYGF